MRYPWDRDTGEAVPAVGRPKIREYLLRPKSNPNICTEILDFEFQFWLSEVVQQRRGTERSTFHHAS